MMCTWADYFSKFFYYFFVPFKFPAHFARIIRLTFSQRSLVRELIRLKAHHRWFASRKFKTIMDVGANTGPFAFAMRLLQPYAQIYAFEPLPHCYHTLVDNLSPLGEFAAFQTALGNQEGEVEMWESDFSESSSLLPMDDLHKSTFPHTANTHSVKVPISKLDFFLSQMDLKPPVLLKLDVQGYELRVLEGAVKTLSHVDWIITEMSFKPLYQNQALFDDVYQWLLKHRFKFAGIMDSLISPLDGSFLQADGMFFRR